MIRSLVIENTLMIWSLVICKMNIFKKSTFLLSIASTGFLLLQHISLLNLSKLNISSFSLLLSYFLSKRPQFLHSISMDLPKKPHFSLHLQTCQSSVYAVRCLDFGNSTGRTAPSAKVKVVLVQQIHQHHQQKQLLAYTWKTTFLVFLYCPILIL